MHALGLSWNTASDTLHFKLDNPLCTTISKRDVLSRIAQFFDPLGLLSPLIIQAKVFMQELWMIKVSWDMQLHKAQSNTWNRILHGMIRFERIKIPRWIGFFSSVTMKLHGFCDASQTAMAAVVYVRVISRNKSISTSLLCSKTKVAPLKRMTIPRLELSAAVMLAKLISNVQRILNCQKSACHLWTDSRIVHAWLNSYPSRWKDFVHNRVCLIQETVPHAQWHPISGKINPADCATRGLSVSQLEIHQLW